MFLSMTSQLYNSLGEAPLVSQVKMWHRFLTAIPPSDDRRREVHHAVAQSAAETSDRGLCAVPAVAGRFERMGMDQGGPPLVM